MRALMWLGCSAADIETRKCSTCELSCESNQKVVEENMRKISQDPQVCDLFTLRKVLLRNSIFTHANLTH